LDTAFGSTSRPGNYSIIDRFALEAERSRAKVDYKENATVHCILIPFFLHMYYSSTRRHFTATLLLREALTLCELLDLDKESMDGTLDVEEQKFRRKVFWLLFVTERGNAMQYDSAAVLRNTISLPDPEDDQDPVVFAAFLSLVHLFVSVDGTLVGSGAHVGQIPSTKLFSQLQQRLRDGPKIPPHSSEVQKTDICVTQQWYVWVFLKPKDGSSKWSQDANVGLAAGNEERQYGSRLFRGSALTHISFPCCQRFVSIVVECLT